MDVKELIHYLQNNCNKDDKVYLKLWNSDVKKEVYVKTEGSDGYPYDKFIIITSHD